MAKLTPFGIARGWAGKPPAQFSRLKHDQSTKDLVGYWLFNEGAGNAAYDLSGNGNKIELFGGFSRIATDCGHGVGFDGTSGYGDIGELIADNDAFTISALVKIRDKSSGQPLVTRGADGYGDGWSIFVGWSYNKQAFIASIVTTSAGATQHDAVSSVDPVLNTWYRIRAVWTPAKHLKIYVDGVLTAITYISDTTLRSSTVGFNAATFSAGVGYSSAVFLDADIYNVSSSDEDAWSAYANPYQDLQPRKIWVPVGISAASSGTFNGITHFPLFLANVGTMMNRG